MLKAAPLAVWNGRHYRKLRTLQLGMVVAIESVNSNPYLYRTTSKEFCHSPHCAHHEQGIPPTRNHQHPTSHWSPTMKVCGLVLSLALLLSSAPEFTRGGRISFQYAVHDYAAIS